MAMSEVYSLATTETILRAEPHSSRSLAKLIGCGLRTARRHIQLLRSSLVITDYEMAPGKGLPYPIFEWRRNSEQKDLPTPTRQLLTVKEREEFAWDRKFKSIANDRDQSLKYAKTPEERLAIHRNYRAQSLELKTLKAEKANDRRRKQNEAARIKYRIENDFFARQPLSLANVWSSRASNSDQVSEQA